MLRPGCGLNDPLELSAIGVDGSPARSVLTAEPTLASVIITTTALYARRGHQPPWICHLAF